MHERPSLIASPPPLWRLWRALSHPILLLILLSIAALALAAQVWLPQAPTALAADPIARNAWISAASANLPAGAALATLGALDVAHHPALRVLLSLLAVVLVLRLLDRIYLAGATRRLVGPLHWLPTTSTFEIERPASESIAPDDRRLQARAQRSQSSNASAEAPAQAHADRNQVYTWAGILIELGLLLALLAILLNLRYGWQSDELSLDPGAAIALTPYSDRAISLDPSGQTLTVCCDPSQSADDFGKEDQRRQDCG